MPRRFLFAACFALLLTCAGSAPAGWGCGYGTNYYGYGLPAGWYTGVQDRLPPYFALHPPVYYSGQIQRLPYGSSPFACPLGLPCQQTEAPSTVVPEEVSTGLMVENEFVLGKKLQVHSGQWIDNPYFSADVKVAER